MSLLVVQHQRTCPPGRFGDWLTDAGVELDVRRPQVTIEAAIVEVTGELGERLGVQLAAGGAVPESGVIGGR